MLDLDAGLYIDRLRTVDLQLDGVADQHVGHLLSVGVLCHNTADVSTFSQNDDAVGELFHLIHLVGDDDDRLSGVAHVAKDIEEFLCLLRCQDGCGLIQDQDIRTAVEDLYDLNGLLLRDGHIVDLLVRVDLKAVLVAQLPDPLRDLFNIESALFMQSQRDVLGCRKNVDQLEVLVDHTDPVFKRILRGCDDDLLPVIVDLPGIRKINTGKHIHQRRLAAAVFSQDRQDLTAVDVQSRVFIGHDRTERLGDVSHFDDRFSFFQNSFPLP